MAAALLFACAIIASSPEENTARQAMVELIAARGVSSPVVLDAMRRFPRHELVPVEYRKKAYADRPLPIGRGQTISQPYMVAFMTEVAAVGRGDKVLEVGTGSGYQAGVLALTGARVFSIEIIKELAERARKDLERIGIEGVTIRHGDGYAGWPKEAPFDAIVVTAAPEKVPPALLEQLKEGGRLVIPVGPLSSQVLEIYTRRGKTFERRKAFPVRFVPMTGEAERR